MPGLKVHIKRYKSTAYWYWDLKDKPDSVIDANEEPITCGICRQAFEATCPDCLFPGDDCAPVMGECSHSFHMHCIVKWLQAQTAAQAQLEDKKAQCPLCRADWQFKKD